ncbi:MULTISPECIES: alpha-keto acid decarboxylase family protein [unclassified Rothia (in: high G+C Gram-positive bacteria)]|uniref:alpha-keto acid decarboxylase family protein n=1 Tax=unclassified Rothia (in: high G+C Gram-positive bacteria) TaxID=2689056 RepID=UPI0019588E1F|nr:MULTISPECIES: thiamine pyrophosphate-binding protein [unclassified Rothia (in: high G+C Gram-positive bacteria)]MBM7052283.1 alpha-keto acid decarboxylase family protein [Rothia sp. ZJ1223]QRZ61517.1 alpha-keto acid decarboxylase family protein [Rothia sp. ZJ932]
MSYKVANYLLDRLAELGVTDIFGVPGDFNLGFLDDVLDHEKLEWVGNMNELNAGYAADGYARVRGLGALVTTYGVGELSSINATAGSYAENVPVIHIVGAPSTAAQNSHLRVHHTLGDGDFKHFIRMADEVNAATAILQPATAAFDIDRVLRDAVVHSKPGYLMLPADVASAEINPPAAPLEVKLQISTEVAKTSFREAATEFLRGKKTSVLVDYMTARLQATDDLQKLIETTDFPYCTLMGAKALIDENNTQFAGIYLGTLTADETRTVIEDAEAIILSAVAFTDTNTVGFSHKVDMHKAINLGAESATIGRDTFAPLALADALDILAEVALEVGAKPMDYTPFVSDLVHPEPSDDALTQQQLWDVVASNLDELNTVVVEMGTSFFGMASRGFPKDARFIGAPLWGSIGYTLPALLGATIADRGSRGVLFIGDGSAQLTIQELATIVRHGLNPVIFLINNDGYTIERAIHGKKLVYNDIAPMDWQKIPAAFGATDETAVVLRASTVNELLDACATAQVEKNKMVFIEVITEKDDMPETLRKFGAMAAAANKLVEKK